MGYSFGAKLKQLRISRGWTQEELAEILNDKYETTYNKSMISKWENEKGEPRMESVRNIADLFKITLDELLGLDKKDIYQPKLNEKDEKDIQKELQKMIEGLESNSGYAAFDGQSFEDLDEDDRDLLKNSLEQSLRLAKKLAKQKFTPKKYRD